MLVRLPSRFPWALWTARAFRVRSEISRRSFSASAAQKVQHEGVGIDAELGDDEQHPLRHQVGDEGDVAGEPIELSDDHRAPRCLGCCGRRGELRTPIESIRTLAGFDLGELRNLRQSLGFGEACDGRLLSLDSEAGTALSLRGDAAISDEDLGAGQGGSYTNRIPPFAVV